MPLPWATCQEPTPSPPPKLPPSWSSRTNPLKVEPVLPFPMYTLADFVKERRFYRRQYDSKRWRHFLKVSFNRICSCSGNAAITRNVTVDSTFHIPPTWRRCWGGNDNMKWQWMMRRAKGFVLMSQHVFFSSNWRKPRTNFVIISVIGDIATKFKKEAILALATTTRNQWKLSDKWLKPYVFSIEGSINKNCKFRVREICKFRIVHCKFVACDHPTPWNCAVGLLLEHRSSSLCKRNTCCTVRPKLWRL